MDNLEGMEFEDQEEMNQEAAPVPHKEELAEQQAVQVMDTAMGIITTSAKTPAQSAEGRQDNSAVDKPKNDGGGILVGDPDVGSAFSGLPMEALISKPFVAAALSQQELSAIYVDTVLKLAYKDGKGDDQTANTLDLTLQRPVIKDGGEMSSAEVKVNAPLLSLIPLPALTMDEVTVDFNMEVKTNEMSSSETKSDASSKVSFKSWFGLNAEITGNVTSDSQHKRQSDSSATYTVHARAIQQPPAEGMQKLTSLLSNIMEPIDTRKSGS